jgi:BirA family biotin operon repressor/biotin-[acetyl-CoA-carboxylase] ligase
MTDARFDRRRFEARLASRAVGLGRPLTTSAVTGSTNDDAMVAARQGAPSGALFVADEQTHGRGRRGREWTSAPGQNLTFSLVLRPKVTPDSVSAMTLVVGLAVRAAAARWAPDAMIKWPNDVLIGPRKLAGILLESHLVGSEVSAVVAGIGVNVAQTDFPPSIADTATSLFRVNPEGPTREDLLVEILAELDLRLGAFEGEGLCTLVDELCRYDALLGKWIRVEDLVGRSSGIDPSGALRVEDANGRHHAVQYGTVQVLDGPNDGPKRP